MSNRMNNTIKIGAQFLQKIRQKLMYAPIYEFIYSPLERILYSKQFICRFDPIKSFPLEERRISVAITHYERPDLLIVSLKNIFRDERVSEIVILDDGSSLEIFLKCAKNIEYFGSKVRLFRRKQNLGLFATKMQVCSLCSNSWCILLDSDNTIFNNYLNAIFSIKAWEQDIIYCPDYAFPHYDFRSYGNSIFDFTDICNLQKSSRILTNSFIFSCLMNDANYFLNTKSFTTILEPYLKLRSYAADSIIANYIWLSEGNKLKVLSRASYYHRIHSNSTWILNSKQGHVEYNIIAKKIEEEQRATLGSLLFDFETVGKINQNIEYIPLEIN